MYDFYSDTKTKPTLEMRRAVLDAVVGDEQKDEDPTTLLLCERVAELLGKESAVFMPSGTMCNQVALRVHTSPGDAVICDETCHLIHFETAGHAALAGVTLEMIEGENGTFTADDIKKVLRPPSRYLPRARLAWVEQTTNLAGGCVWPLERLQEVYQLAKQEGMATHMDGARLLNAVVASGIPASKWCEGLDSCWIDFSKGLGAPVGAVLAGSRDFIDEAWRLKQQMGGAMRQSGILASMGLYALDHHVERLAEDHTRAQKIAKRIEENCAIDRLYPVETNIIIFEISKKGLTAPQLVENLKKEGVLIGAFGSNKLRIVTHLDVDDKATEILCAALEKHLPR